ncbi:MAG TPA: molybdopterin cofactor-binding domain-containing protein [Candidatus Angelobacter sp.]|nr:molybdopterin cofactor-binding domain-containing protein [Candidatus Angelobacter sp.]
MTNLELQELEQHTIEQLRYAFEVNRRDLFKFLGAGLVIGMCAPTVLAQESGRRSQGQATPEDISSWLHIGSDGKITVFTGKVEMGQNIRTSLAQHVAEELRVPMDSITMIMGDTQLTPFDMGTFGSRTTPQMGTQLRKVSASAREVLIDMAAQQWKVDRSLLSAHDGVVVNSKNGEKITYSAITKGEKIVKVISRDVVVAPASNWHVAGINVPKVAGKSFVTGDHQYTSDITRLGMLHGKVLRPSAFNATLTSLDTGGAEKLPNVQVVHDGSFAGVVAADSQIATKALDLLKAQWNAPSQPSEAELFDYLRKNPEGNGGGFGGRGGHETGSIDSGMASANKKLEQTYTVAYIAHTPLEPRAAVAEWSDGRLTVWTGTQRPFGVRDELVEAFHLPPDHVRVLVPDTGSAYGGKHTGDAAVEAARLAKAAGKPVKVVWTRQEELTWAYFRPAGVIDIKSGVRDDGTLVAWEFHNYNSGPAAIGTPYNVPNQRIEFHPTKYPLRQGSYRGLAATANHFARESHMDELASLVKLDPLQFRLKNISDSRLRDIFEAAATRFGWDKQRPSEERGFGIAGGIEKGGYTAACAEVAVDRSAQTMKIVRVAVAFDCGAVVNPSGLRNQVSGAIVQGIGGALFEAIHFQNGKILNPRLSDYRVPRFRDTPKIDVEIIDRKDVPSAGAGETPIVGLAPAVGNAIFNATGRRLRALPMLATNIFDQHQQATNRKS